MSRFAEQFERVGGPALVAWFADSVSYTDHTLVAAKSVDAMLTREVQERRKDTLGGWSVVTTRTARYLTSELSVTPRIDGTLTADGYAYSIEHINAIEGGFTLLQLKRVQPGEITRPGYRGR